MNRFSGGFETPWLIAAVIFGIWWGGCSTQTEPPAVAQIVRKKVPDVSASEIAQTPISQKISIPPEENKAPETGEPPDPILDPIPILSDVHQLTYRAEGRADPFTPLFRDEPEEPSKPAVSGRKKRIPQTPLEKMDLSQIKLTAVFRTAKGFRALVEESTGKGYMIDTGTYLGINSGKVISIQPNAVLVEEEVEDALGNVRMEVRELRLMKPVGEP
jgi:type IV pilus assembly protein PilP